jgi:hypothetical protein
MQRDVSRTKRAAARPKDHFLRNRRRPAPIPSFMKPQQRRRATPFALANVAVAVTLFALISHARAAGPPEAELTDTSGFRMRLGAGVGRGCILFPPEREGGDACDTAGANGARKSTKRVLDSGTQLVGAEYVEVNETSAVYTVTRDGQLTTAITQPEAWARAFRSSTLRSMPTARYLGPANEAAVSVSTLEGLQVLGADMTVEVPGADGEGVAIDIRSYVVPTKTGTYVVQAVGRRGASALSFLHTMASTIRATPPPTAKSPSTNAYDASKLLAELTYYVGSAALVACVIVVSLIKGRRKRT